MTGPTTALLMMTLLGDARLPSGGHAHSAGLEPAVRAGLRAHGVPALIDARLRTVVRIDAGTAVVCRAAALRPHLDEAADVLRGAWHAWAARSPSAAARSAAVDVGRGYRRLLDRLWGGSAAQAALARAEGAEQRVAPRCRAPRAVVLGVIAAASGLDARQTAALVGYDDVQTVAAACLKLEPLDPVVVTGWTVATFPRLEAMADELADLTDPTEIPASGAPLVDQWAEAHAHRTERLFRA